VLSKCANPACPASFRYLHEGRIFTLISGPEFSAIPAVWDSAVEHAVERYWLCHACAQTMTVCRINDRAVVRRLPRLGAPSRSRIAA
jgi:hypothetical protein